MFKCNLGVVCDVFACGQGASGLDNIRPLEMRVESGSQLTYAAYASIYVSIRQRLRQHTRACSQHLLHCLLPLRLFSRRLGLMTVELLNDDNSIRSLRFSALVPTIQR